MSVITEILIPLVIVGFIAWWRYQLNKNQTYYKNIPSPPGNLILGNALDFKTTSDVLNTFMKYTREYGEIVKLKIGPLETFILITDYKLLETIFSSNKKFLTKSVDYIFMEPWLGKGLLTSDGAKWKNHRRILTPGFHFQILEYFIDVFESCGNKLIEKLKKEVGKDSVDVYPLVTLCALDIICESTMGVSVNAQDNENSDYVRSVKDMCRIIIERVISPLQMYDFLYPLTKNFYTQRKALKILHAHTNAVIDRRREELKNKNKYFAEEAEGLTRNKKVFLDLLLEAVVDGRPLTHEEIREEVDTFMFEGHDTTTSAISFTLFCLAKYPDVQEKALEEQKCLFGNDQHPNVTYADLQNMKYLEQIIKETLRLYPSVPFYARQLVEDFDYGNTTFAKGDTLTIFAYGIHRNAKYFNDPETFNPDRFSNYDGSHPYAYIPFSAGPRNCIGQKFAMLEMKSTISKLLRTFELHPAVPEHQLKLVSETILKSSNGIRIRLKPRY